MFSHIVKTVERIRKIIRTIKPRRSKIISNRCSKDEDVVNGFAKIGEEVGNIDGVYHSIAFANIEDLRGRFSETSREGFYLRKISVHIH